MATNDLVRETIESAHEYSKKMIDAIDIIYQHIQLAEEDQVLSIFSDFTLGLEWLVKAVDLTSAALEKVIETSSIDEILEKVEDALKSKDYVMMGDILYYELKPMLQEWNVVLGANLG